MAPRSGDGERPLVGVEATRVTASVGLGWRGETVLGLGVLGATVR